MEEHHLHAYVEQTEMGMASHVILVPLEVSDALEKAGHRRIILRVGNKTYRRALIGRKDGQQQIVLSKVLMRELGLQLGDGLDLSLQSDPEPDRLDIPEAFQEVLAQDPAAAERFAKFTTGKQRSILHYVTSAKRVETQVKRALELAEKIRTRTLHSDR